MESADDVHSALLAEDGIIVAFDEEALAAADSKSRRGGRCRVVDLQGLHVFPALIDSHLHMLEAVALSGVGVPLCRFEQGRVEPRDLAGIEQLVRAHAAGVREGSLLVYTNFISITMAERRLPTRLELDEWTQGARAWVLNIDGHSSSCSTALLKALGLEEIAPDGILSGEAHDMNLGVISSYLSSCITPGVLARGIADFCNDCASFGIGTVCALEGTDDTERDRLTELTAFLAQRLPLDVRLIPQYMDERKLARVLPRMGAKRVGGCMKWELDGSIGSRTAAFARPYSDGSRVPLYFRDDSLERAVKGFAERGFFVTAHAIGELAIEQLVDLYEQVGGTHRIDHCEFPAPDILPRLCALKPFVTVQPGYSWIDKRYLHGYEHFLDEALLSQQVPLKDFEDHGVLVCGSSDAPVQSVDPFLQMRGMREFYVESQSLTAFEALKTYTVNAGRMLGENKGLLRPGFEASFFTIEQDLLQISPEELEHQRAEALYLRGRPYRKLPRSLTTLARLLVTPARKI